jgi:hypothetical protein
MKKYLSGTLFILITSGALSIFISGCKKNTGDDIIAGQAPTVTTGVITVVTQTSSTGGGDVTNDGNAAVTSRGLCWSTNQQPTIADSKTSNGTGTGTFTSSLTGLTDGTTYYARAYATNSFGTGYGNTVLFTALVPGETYQGGILVYVLQPGDPGYIAGVAHGLICTPTDSQIDTRWLNHDYSITGATGIALRTGSTNTSTIISKQGAGSYTAEICAGLQVGGYKDWFLPSKDELNKLYLSKAKIPGLYESYYWSSSEAGSNTAWIQSFVNGAQSSYDKKGNAFRVRAFRSF